MDNKVTVENPKRKWLKWTACFLTLVTVLLIILLFTVRAINTRNYNGQVYSVSGVIVNVNYDGDDGIEIELDDGKVYNGNPLNNFDKDLNLDALVGENVTLYIPQNQLGLGLPWIVGIKQGDDVLVDYNELIANGLAQNRLEMIIVGVIAGVFAVATCGVLVWQTRVTPTKEEDLYKLYCDINIQRQPSCPEFKILNIYLLAYIAYTLLICTVIGIVGSLVENETILIAVCVPLCVVFVAATAGMFVVLAWVIKRERKFYAENFPFDFTDVTHVAMRKKFKEELQAHLKADRERYPHRYGDGGNGYTVEFCDIGLKFYDYDPLKDEYDEQYYPTTEEVFGVEDSEREERYLVCTLSYETLNFVALPHYRKRDRSLAVVIKSRLNTSELPRDMANDIHLILDSNLLATLRQFNVPVEDLQYILDNKAQLIEENCPKAKVTERRK